MPRSVRCRSSIRSSRRNAVHTEEPSDTSISPATWIPALPFGPLVLQGETAYIQAGGGVVYDSDPAAEYEETISKARGLLKAIEIAESSAPPLEEFPQLLHVI